MRSNISSAASSLPEKARACTHSALTAPIRDSVAALSHGLEADPMGGAMPFSSVASPMSGDVCRLPRPE